MSRVGGGGRTSPLSRGGGAVAPCPLCLRPCMIHRLTYIHRYVNTLLSVSVILLHVPCTSESANTYAYFLRVLTFLPQSPQSVPPPQPNTPTHTGSPSRASPSGFPSDVIMTPVSYFGLPRCSPKDPRTLDIGKVNSPQSHNLPKDCDGTLC